jgi:hypothetical protein
MIGDFFSSLSVMAEFVLKYNYFNINESIEFITKQWIPLDIRSLFCWTIIPYQIFNFKI